MKAPLFFMFRALALLSLLSLWAVPALAQVPAPAPAPAAPGNPLAQILRNTQERLECFPDNHCTLTGLVEIELAANTRFHADVIDIYVDPDLRIVATGNVVFATPEGRITAERVEFNATENTGIFEGAYGSLLLEGASRAEFGNQDPHVDFYGEVIEKVGPRTYTVSNGGFTTCTQPTPRWDIVSESITFTLDEYAMARNMLLRVKGVPLFYLPVIYYPIRDEDRATGFLLPSYGTSSIRGQAVSNAFFWAMGRSHDMTLFHDWFTKAGQGAGVEYRYMAAANSYGDFRFYRFGQRETEFVDDGASSVLPAQTSYEFRGNGNQMIGQNIRLYQRVDYTTDVVTRQLYQQNVYQASNASRTIQAGLTGTWGGFNTSALFQRTETFTGEDTSQLYGSTPRLTASVAPTQLGLAPVYVSVNGDFAYLPNRTIRGGEITSDRSVGRFDVQPQIQAALSRLTFLSVNTTAAYRMTQYSWNASSSEPVLRKYLSLRTEAIGPVLAKIWDTPDSGFSERMKHVIEPTFTVDYVTDIANLSLVPDIVDSSDRIVGGSTRFTYGLNNRFLYRARTTDGSPGSTFEFLTIGLQQTYYFNPQASLTDTEYTSASLHSAPVDLSNVALLVRLSPGTALDATTRMEYDVHGNGLQVVASGITARQGASTTSVSFSRQVSDRASVTSSLAGSTTVSLLEGRLTGGYGLTWDIARSALLNQTIGATYLAQCCGIQAEFQKFKYPVATALFPIAADRRFNVSFVLAGLGTFSNFFGAFDSLVGVQR